MMNKTAFLFIGFGKSSQISASILLKEHHSIYAYDQNANLKKTLNNSLNFTQVAIQEFKQLPHNTIAVLSPGIPYHHPVIQKLKKLHIPSTTELELLYKYRPNLKYIGISGTMGKSTLTVLIADMLSHGGYKVGIGGNFDQPALSLLHRSIDIAVIEVSSYMASWLHNIQFFITCLINIFPHHLNWHRSFEHYYQAKINLLRHTQPHGYIFLGNQFQNQQFHSIPLTNILSKIESKNIHTQPIGLKKNTTSISVNNTHIHDPKELSPIPYKLSSTPQTYMYPIIGMLWGVGRNLGIDKNTILQSLHNFKGLPHRQEILPIGSQRYAVNASKATNILMATNCLINYTNIYWIAGGQRIQQNISYLKSKSLINRINHAYFIGQSAPDMYDTFQSVIPCTLCNTLSKAVQLALQDSKKDMQSNARICKPSTKESYNSLSSYVILLAPAYPSWDQFKDFEERGTIFKQQIYANIS